MDKKTAFINAKRTILNNYASTLIHNLKQHFAAKILPLNTTHLWNTGQPNVYGEEPAVYLTGGAAYIAYDTFSNNRASPMEYNAPATYDWDITIHLKEKLTYKDQLDILEFIKRLLVFIPGLQCDMPTVAKDQSYYNYDFYLIFDEQAFNIFEVSFKPSPPPISGINVLHINALQILPVPTLHSLMNLSLLGLNNRAPIKLNKSSGKFKKNEKFYKCIQDYYRLMFILSTLDFYRADLIPTPAQLHTFNIEFQEVILRHPHCKTNIFKAPRVNQISQEKKNALSDKLWETKLAQQQAARLEQSRMKQQAARLEQSRMRQQAARLEEALLRVRLRQQSDSQQQYFSAEDEQQYYSS